MCRRTVRKGLVLMVAGIISVTLATFFHHQLSTLFFLSGGRSAGLTFYGFALGAASGATGVLVTTAGLLRRNVNDRSVRLLPVVLLLVASIAFFCFLSYLSFTGALTTDPNPGESITI
ncbi:hypothetical protein LPW11_01310 [Geomonas sp. RF6]|uniref:hypothetical protein n=1 Tax=Geomonas sp. RF6 TaxID=2897342 RepID=UPI001E45BA93|nr:hypothetical protein [Geomonas sp. RF6]UFS70837.1 hypothetical protein LPW11_01310 [Geomonas sp. RF6]